MCAANGFGVDENDVRAEHECRLCGNGSSKSSTESLDPFRCACSRASSKAWNGLGLPLYGPSPPCKAAMSGPE